MLATIRGGNFALSFRNIKKIILEKIKSSIISKIQSLNISKNFQLSSNIMLEIE